MSVQRTRHLARRRAARLVQVDAFVGVNLGDVERDAARKVSKGALRISSLLNLGSATAGEIAYITGLHIATVNRALESLRAAKRAHARRMSDCGRVWLGGPSDSELTPADYVREPLLLLPIDDTTTTTTTPTHE